MQAYTVEQVAKMLNISRDKVYYLLRTRDFIASLEDDHAAETRAGPTVTA